MPKIIAHLARGDATPRLRGRHLRLYRIIRDMAQREGIQFEIHERPTDIGPGTREVEKGRFDEGHLHLIDDRSVRAPGVLNTAVAYFWEFWHIDPVGTKALSSIGAQSYRPSEMPYARAKVFFDRLRREIVATRRSKYRQREDRTRVSTGALAVFLQGDFPIKQGVTTFDDLSMVETLRDHAGDRPIVIKPHPLATDLATLLRLQAIAAEDSRIALTDANVHDLLQSCAATVSINSTVALEGFLHRKPAILFGQSDFHHHAGRVFHPEDFPAVLSAELERQGGYAQYLAWYFLRHCIGLRQDDLEARVWDRFAQAGCGRETFGLGPL